MWWMPSSFIDLRRRSTSASVYPAGACDHRARAGRIAHPALRARAARSARSRCSKGSIRSSTRCASAPTCSRCVTQRPQRAGPPGGDRSRPTSPSASARSRARSTPALFEQLAPLAADDTGVIALAERPARRRPQALLADAAARAARAARGSARPRQHRRMRARRGRRGRRRRAQHAAATTLAPRRAARRRRAALRAARRAARSARTRSPLEDRPLLAARPRRRAARSVRARPARGARLRHRAPRPQRASCSRAPTRSVSIPMRPGVSSLNLATSVAAVLFAWRLRARARHPRPPEAPARRSGGGPFDPVEQLPVAAQRLRARRASARLLASGSASASSSLDQLARPGGRARRRAARARGSTRSPALR